MPRHRHLRQERQQIGLPAYLLSELCGLNHGAVSLYEKGLAEPNSRSLLALADVLGVSTDYLLGRTHEPMEILHRKEVLI